MIRVVCEQTSLNAIDIADLLRPVQRGTFVFLDSSSNDGREGRYAIVGRHPWYDCRVIDGQTMIDGQPVDVDVWTAVRQFLLTYQEDVPPGVLPPEIPFKAGLIGYFAYDLAVQMSQGKIPLPEASDLDGPQAWLAAFDQMVIIDQTKSRLCLLAWGKLMDPSLAIEQLQQDLRQPLAKRIDSRSSGADHSPLPTVQPDQSFWAARSNFSRDAFCQRVEDVRQAIKAGEVYILNLTQRFLMPQTRDPWASYCQLRHVSPTPYAAYVETGSLCIMSFSMEQFLQVRGRTVTTRPIKGTRPRGSNPAEDERNRSELLNSRKDQAELLMIVDLERNDLSRVCEPASVNVEGLFRLETYSTVFHLVATVFGQLAEGHDAVSCFQACFPGGSITGAPKIRAMQLISEFENLRRGLYTGCLGYFSLDGQADFNIMIRTIISSDARTCYHAGGGITWDSDPQAEYQETLDKASAIGGVFSC